MPGSTFLLICLQALLIQNAYSQFLNYGNLGLTGVDFDVQATSSARAGLEGYLGNGGLINYPGTGNLGLSGLGLANAAVGGGLVGLNGLGVSNVGLGVSNIGLNQLSLGNAGVTAAGLSNAGLALGGIGYGVGVPNVAATSGIPVTGPFTANGEAELVVGGDFAVGGQAVVGGQIPVLGAVSFNGAIPASGVVSIAGNCGCSRIPL
ncbi:hypothetical protein evm_001804 [Chilo suppressalis]|nr:hypothetical protein evm_001804 [Chilo suppressalis]